MIVRSCATRARSSKTRRSPSTCSPSASRLVEPGAPEGSAALHFLLRARHGINAFALPGGFIGVNCGPRAGDAQRSASSRACSRTKSRTSPSGTSRARIQNAGPREPRLGRRHARGHPDRRGDRLPSDAVLGGVTAAQGSRPQQPDQLHARQRRRSRPRRHRHPRCGAVSTRSACPNSSRPCGSARQRRPQHSRNCCAPTRSPASASPNRATAQAACPAADARQHELRADARPARARDARPPKSPRSTYYAQRRRARTTRPPTQSYGRALALVQAGEPRRRYRCSRRCATAART